MGMNQKQKNQRDVRESSGEGNKRYAIKSAQNRRNYVFVGSSHMLLCWKANAAKFMDRTWVKGETVKQLVIKGKRTVSMSLSAWHFRPTHNFRIICYFSRFNFHLSFEVFWLLKIILNSRFHSFGKSLSNHCGWKYFSAKQKELRKWEKLSRKILERKHEAITN